MDNRQKNYNFWKKVAKRFGEKKKVRIFAARFGKNRVIPEVQMKYRNNKRER